MSNPLVVGIDVHRVKNVVVVMDQNGRVVKPSFSVHNNRPGTSLLATKLHTIAQENGFDVIQIGVEATGWYWWHLVHAMHKDCSLNQLPTELYAFNPRVTARFGRSYSNPDKTDSKDASKIADWLRLGRDLPKPYNYDEWHYDLRCLTRHRYYLVREVTRIKNYMSAYLYLKASEYSRIQPLGKTFGTTSRGVIRDFGDFAEILDIPFEDLVEQIDKRGRRRFTQVRKKAEALRTVATDSYHLPEELQSPVNIVLNQCIDHMELLERQIKDVERDITAVMGSIPNTLKTIPGIGLVFASGILAEIGDLNRFDYDQKKVASYAGLAWKQTQSGDHTAEERPLKNAGNRILRYYLCEAANSMRVHAEEYGEYYARKYKEVRTHKHKRAIVMTARKLVRLVVRLLATNQPYQPRPPKH